MQAQGVNETLGQLLMVMEALDEKIAPMLEQDGSHFNKWVVMRCFALLPSQRPWGCCGNAGDEPGH